MVADAVNEWLRHNLPETRNLSANAIRSYRTGLDLYFDYLESEHGIRRETLAGKCFETETIERWLAWMKDTRGCSPSTCNQRMAALRSFLMFMSRKDAAFIRYGSGVVSIRRMKTVKNLPEVISRETSKALFASIDTSSMTGRRDLALFNTMYSTATRVNEILSLEISDIDLFGQNPHISVVGKGNKRRCIYLLSTEKRDKNPKSLCLPVPWGKTPTLKIISSFLSIDTEPRR